LLVIKLCLIIRKCSYEGFHHFIILFKLSVFGLAVNITDVFLAAIDT